MSKLSFSAINPVVDNTLLKENAASRFKTLLSKAAAFMDAFKSQPAAREEVELKFTTLSALSQEEITQFYELTRLTGYRYPERYLEEEHFVHNPDMALFSVDNQIVAFYGFNVYELPTPFKKQPIPVVYIGLAFVHPDFLHLGLSTFALKEFYKKYLGSLWYLKSHILLTRTMNPKAIRALHSIYDYVLPNRNIVPGEDMMSFINSFNTEQRKGNVQINNDLIIKNVANGAFRMDLTSQWEKYFRTRDSRYDDLVFGRIVSLENGRYLANGDVYFSLAYYDFRKLISRKIKKMAFLA